MPTAVMHISHQPRRPAGVHAYTEPSSHAAAKRFVLPVTRSTAFGRKSCQSDCPLLVQVSLVGSWSCGRPVRDGPLALRASRMTVSGISAFPVLASTPLCGGSLPSMVRTITLLTFGTANRTWARAM